MNCESNVEKLVDCARGGNEPGGALKIHLRTCDRCLDRWEAERELSASLRTMRMELASRRSSPAARRSLMQEFDSRQAVAAGSRRQWRFGYWALGAAAVLLLGVLLGPEARTRLHPGHATGAPAESSEALIAVNDADSDGFIAVPFAPPLATGERLRIVHTELDPAALVSLGVSVDPGWTTQLPADVLEGEDGMPRAIRVSETESSSESGF
jgi:anti-sigma-K factor RskA